MKFNNITLINVYQVLMKFNSVSGKLGYAISKTKKQMMPEIEIFEQEKQKLFEKYGKKNEQKGQLFIKQDSENYEKFMKEFQPIAEDILIEINIFQVTEEEFENNESLFEVKDATVSDFDLLQALFIKKDKTE